MVNQIPATINPDGRAERPAPGDILVDTAGNPLAGGGFFSDGAGTNAAIGQGATAPTAAGTNALAQGNACNATGDQSIAIGNGNNVQGNNSVGIGNNCDVGASADRSWAFGSGVNATVADSKLWGSNSSDACYGWITSSSFASGASATTLLTLPLEEDKAYSLRGLIVGKDDQASSDAAAWILPSPTLAVRFFSNPVTLAPAGPIALTASSSGGAAASWTAELTAVGNTVELSVTLGVPDSGFFTAHLEWIEVFASS